MQIIAGSNNMFAGVTGVTPEYQQVFNTSVTNGDFIDQYDYDRKSKVALIGSEVAATLFGEDDPVGQKIRMGNTIFTVTGVLESKGASMLGNTDYAIYVPLSTLQGMMSRSISTTGQHIVSSLALTVTDQM
jgi:putative ABC transport system permease protein